MRDSEKEFMEELAFEMILKKRQIEMVGGRENSEQRKLRKQR